MGDYTVYYPIFFFLIALFVLAMGVSILKKWYLCYKGKLNFKKTVASGLPMIDKMDGLQFEVFLMYLYKELGYKVKATKASHDYGADLILEGKETIVIQAKRYGLKNKVGIKAIQEVFTAKTFLNADQAWVVTNSGYTKSAKEVAVKCNVRLIDRTDLKKMLLQIKPTVTAAHVYKTVEPKARKCPFCKNELIVRKKEEDRFFGCSTFPVCRHTEAINSDN